MKGKICTFLLCSIILFPPLSAGAQEQTITLANGNVETFATEFEMNDISLSDAFQFFTQQLEVFFIISAGSGLHFAFPPSFVGSPLLQIHFSFFPSVVYCNYGGSESSTDIIPLFSPENATTISGSHKILVIGFIGILGWEGVFSFSDTGFTGFAFFVWTS